MNESYCWEDTELERQSKKMSTLLSLSFLTSEMRMKSLPHLSLWDAVRITPGDGCEGSMPSVKSYRGLRSYYSFYYRESSYPSTNYHHPQSCSCVGEQAERHRCMTAHANELSTH